MNQEELIKLDLLSSALRAIGGNFDIPSLELIFTLNKLLDDKGDNITLKQLKEVSEQIAQKYNLNK